MPPAASDLPAGLHRSARKPRLAPLAVLQPQELLRRGTSEGPMDALAHRRAREAARLRLTGLEIPDENRASRSFRHRYEDSFDPEPKLHTSVSMSDMKQPTPARTPQMEAPRPRPSTVADGILRTRLDEFQIRQLQRKVLHLSPPKPEAEGRRKKAGARASRRSKTKSPLAPTGASFEDDGLHQSGIATGIDDLEPLREESGKHGARPRTARRWAVDHLPLDFIAKDVSTGIAGAGFLPALQKTTLRATRSAPARIASGPSAATGVKVSRSTSPAIHDEDAPGSTSTVATVRALARAEAQALAERRNVVRSWVPYSDPEDPVNDALRSLPPLDTQALLMKRGGSLGSAGPAADARAASVGRSVRMLQPLSRA